ncbi:MAG: ATP-dependent zinc metalloprotease FtsH [Solirubrobacteraceae bacterium]|nr:ATP-dependent zinc metalloprotease FtsH [Solirubrobacteraceae bacterium]
MSNPRLAGGHKQQNAFQRAGSAIAGAGAAVVRLLLKDPLSTFLLVSAVSLTILFFSLLGSLDPKPAGREVPLSTVTSLAQASRITDAELLDFDAIVQVTTTAGTEVYAQYPGSDAATQQLLRTLQSGGAQVSVDPQSFKPTRVIVVQFLIPILLLVALFALFMRLGGEDGAGGIASFSNFKGKGKKRKKGEKGAITFDSVAGAGEALTELKEIRDFLEDPTDYLAFGAAAPKGVLLVGPPGTGKTLLARAVAGEADASFYSVSGAEFVESLVGVGAARIRDLFAKARKTAPSIIFIDEVDAAGRKRGAGVGQGNDEREQTLNQLLVEMDGFGGDAGLVVMAATNRPDILDPALLRPGRFDRQIVIENPDVHGRLEMLQLHARGRTFAADTDLQEIAKLTPGFSGAEIANLVNEAALLSVREQRTEIDQATLEEAIDRVVAGPAKKSHVLSQDEQWVIAIHEASHAVVTRSMGQRVSAQKLSIVARGRQLGTSADMLTDKDAAIVQEPDFQRQLAAILAGAAGERLEFGYVSSGISDDLHVATKIARSMVTSFGMSERLGFVTVGEPAGEVFLGAALQDLGSTGPETLNIIDEECERIVWEAEHRAEFVLRSNWNTVVETAQALMAQETLSGVALDAVLSTVDLIPIESIELPTGGSDRGSRQGQQETQE